MKPLKKSFYNWPRKLFKRGNVKGMRGIFTWSVPIIDGVINNENKK